jgi:hypothetical protein
MKKLVFILAVIATVALVSCGGNATTSVKTDSTKVDSTVVKTDSTVKTVVDTTVTK